MCVEVALLPNRGLDMRIWQNLQAQFKKSAEQLPWGTRVKGKTLMSQISVADVQAMFDRVCKEQNLI